MSFRKTLRFRTAATAALLITAAQYAAADGNMIIQQQGTFRFDGWVVENTSSFQMIAVGWTDTSLQLSAVSAGGACAMTVNGQHQSVEGECSGIVIKRN